MRRSLFALALLALAPASGAWAAAVDSGLPGGASSLQESYDAWSVACRVATDAAGKTQKQCGMSQVQIDKASGKHVLEVDVAPVDTGAAVTLVLPFGLDLTQGPMLQLDAADPGPALSYRTCLPVGCVVRAQIDAKMLSALRAGKVLKIKTHADNGSPADFQVSLTGFGAAFDRVTALLK